MLEDHKSYLNLSNLIQTSVIATNLELKKALRLRNKARKKVAAIIALFGAAAAAALASMGVKMGALAAI